MTIKFPIPIPNIYYSKIHKGTTKEYFFIEMSMSTSTCVLGKLEDYCLCEYNVYVISVNVVQVDMSTALKRQDSIRIRIAVSEIN